MLTRLTTSQQKALLNALPAHRKNAVKSHCQSCQMRGEGFMDILKSIGGVLGPIAKEIGPTVLKEFILPFIKKKMAGNGCCEGRGLNPAGGMYQSGMGLNPAGGTLKLAGQGKKKKMAKGSAEMKAHMARIRAMRK
jgi:hypothetical protein